MVNRVFANKFHLAALVLPIEAYPAFGQGHAQSILFRVDDLLHDPHLRLRGRSKATLLHQVVRLILVFLARWRGPRESSIYIDTLCRNVGLVQEFDLLSLAVAKCGRVLERVQMILVERFLGDWRTIDTATDTATDRYGRTVEHKHVGSHFVYISRHQFDPRVFESLTTAVIQRHPTDQVQIVAFRWCYSTVICFPRHAAGDITELARGTARPVTLQEPIDLWMEVRLVRRHGKQRRP